MAYMTTENVKRIRTELKEKYPNIKFSVRNEDHLAVGIAIMASDIDFSDVLEGRGHTSINHYWIDRNYPTHAELFKGIISIANKGNHDNSDLQSDYHDVGWYVHFAIGKWDKAYVRTEGKK